MLFFYRITLSIEPKYPNTEVSPQKPPGVRAPPPPPQRSDLRGEAFWGTLGIQPRVRLATPKLRYLRPAKPKIRVNMPKMRVAMIRVDIASVSPRLQLA